MTRKRRTSLSDDTDSIFDNLPNDNSGSGSESEAEAGEDRVSLPIGRHGNSDLEILNDSQLSPDLNVVCDANESGDEVEDPDKEIVDTSTTEGAKIVQGLIEAASSAT